MVCGAAFILIFDSSVMATTPTPNAAIPPSVEADLHTETAVPEAHHESGGLPQFDFAHWGGQIVYLLFLFRKDLRFVGTFVTGLVVAMMCAATMGFPTPVGHLQPPLQSPWLVIHVSIAVLASSLFALTAGTVEFGRKRDRRVVSVVETV